jgi:hypothetical protein
MTVRRIRPDLLLIETPTHLRLLGAKDGVIQWGTDVILDEDGPPEWNTNEIPDWAYKALPLFETALA